MKNISKIKDCFGCGVCSAACPKSIINISESNKGFYIPKITDEDKCIACGLCLKVCSFRNPVFSSASNSLAYAGWSKNEKTRRIASSGGIAYELASEAIGQGYKYCGVRYDTVTSRAKHYICDTMQDLLYSLGSKYIPSYTKDAFSALNRKDKFIVFGTPCQIASLRLWIKRMKCEQNYILVDFFCHGVPSLKVWDKYIEVNHINNADVRWRDKKNGWHDSWYIVACDENNQEIYRSDNVNRDQFYKFFLSHLGLSRCCIESCKFKQEYSSADIRIGDLWGETYSNNQEGVSGILCLTKRGNEFLSNIGTIELVREGKEVVLEGQMKENAKKPFGYSISIFLLKNGFELKKILEFISISNWLYNIPKRIIYKLKS